MSRGNSDLPIFHGKDFIKVHAFFLGERIQVRSLEKEAVLAKLPLVIAAPGGGCLIVFRYGVVVLFEVSEEDKAALLNKIMAQIVNPFQIPSTEETSIRIDAGAREELSEDYISLANAGIPRLQLIAEILAKSLMLDRYERHVSKRMDRIEPTLSKLKKDGFRSLRTRDLLDQISDSLLSLHRMTGIAEIGDKPELLWEYPELERLYVRMEDEYEIGERYKALERKMELIFRTADTLQDLLQTKRTLHVEWYIVILIVVEIVIIVYEMFFMHKV